MILSVIKNPHQYNKETKTCYCNCISCGRMETPGRWMHKKSFLNHYHLIYVETGTLFLKNGRQEVTLKEKDVLLLPPFTTIRGTQESNGPTHFYWVDFSTEDPGHFDIIPGKHTLRPADMFADMLKRIVLIAQNANTPDFALDAWLLLLLQEIKQNCQRSSPQQLLVTQTCDYITSHITQPLTVESVAEALQYNKNYLSRMMSQYCGISLKEYISKEKLAVAKRLLTTSNYSIQQIAEYLGYEDSNLFTKFFKYHANMSPGQYRRNQV